MDNKIFSQNVPLYSLAKWTNGLAYKDFHFSTTGIPIIKIAELKNGITSQTQFTKDIFDESVRLNYDDLLFSWSGNPDTSIDVFRYRMNDGWLNQHIFKVIPQGVSKDYLFYLLKSLQSTFAYIASNKQTTGLGHVTIADLKRLNVNVHSLEEQQHIVDILGSIDETIENNEQLINIFENLAAKKYLDFANKTSTKIRLEDVIVLFDSKRIPLSSREREQRKGIYPYYGATGILDYVNGFLFSGEYVLFAEDGTVTDTNGHPIVQLVNGSFWVNNHAHVLKGKNGWNDYTLYVALKQINVDKAVTGAVQPKINQANLLSLEIPNLSNNNLQTINTELDVVFHKVFHLRSENKKLQELKGLYLKKFFE